MKLPDGDRLDAALDLFHDHRWDVQKPLIYELQMAELLVVLRPWFEQEFAPKSTRVPARKPAKADKGSQKLGRDFVYGRSGGWCEIAIPDLCAGLGREWHHRLNRSQGGRWDASNGLHTCTPCHDYVTNRAREEAKASGWAVAPGVTPPIEVPVLRRGVWVYLDDEGGFEPVEGAA
jgi:hypothetical protein